MQLVNFLGLLIVFNSILSVDQWSNFPIGNTTITWVVNFLILILFIIKAQLNFKKGYYIFINIYLIWLLICIFRGIFIANDYWEWKQLIDGSTALCLPIVVYAFSQPELLKIVLSTWVKFAIPLFFLFFIWVLRSDGYHYYLGPILLLSCFLPIVNRKWLCIFLFLLLLMIFADFGARSQVIKSIVALLISGAYWSSKFLSIRVLKITHLLFYLAAPLLVVLGISGVYNVFQNMDSSGKYVQKKIINGQEVEEDLMADTRTFIYQEVIESALNHNYVIWGRTPARGNDSEIFGSYMGDDLKTGRYERFSNEICFTNVFTWVGLIGLVLYCSLYLISSYLALYKSNNIFMKLLGVYISFRFFYGFVEDFNRFDIANISLWMMISMGFSKDFREMDNIQFKKWIRSVF